MITNKLKLMIGALVIGAAAVATVAVTTQSSNLDTLTVAEVGAFKGSNSYCSWENYGVDISQPNYPGHIDNPKVYDEGVSVYLPDTRNGFKFSSSSANGKYTYTLTSAYNRVYVWAAGWKGDTSSLNINGVSVNIEQNALVTGNSLNVDVYYDRYAFTLPEATKKFTFTATNRLIIGGVAWYNDIDISNDIIAIDGPGIPEEPPTPSEDEEGAITIQPTDFTATTSADYSKTKDGITVAVTASTVTADQIRVFRRQTITISSETNITNIEFTCTAKGNTKYGPGNFVATPEGYTFEAEGKKGLWVGDSKSISFTAETNQVRITQIKITLA